MKRLQMKKKLDRTVVRHKLAKGEQINTTEMDIICKGEIPVLTPAHISSSITGKRMEYVIQDCLDLASFLKSGVVFTEFIYIVKKILETIQQCEAFGIRTSNLELQLEYIFYNFQTKKLSMLYWPLISLDEYLDLSYFFENLGMSYVCREEDIVLRNKYLMFFDNRKLFEIYSFEKYLDALDREKKEEIAVTQRIKTVQEQAKQGLKIKRSMQDETIALNYPVLLHAAKHIKIELNKMPFTIGRSADRCDYVLEGHQSISRTHLTFNSKDNALYVRDNHSTNGTKVDGKRIPTEVDFLLHPGCVIELGSEQFIYLAGGTRMNKDIIEENSL